MKNPSLLLTTWVLCCTAQANPTFESSGMLTSKDGKTLHTFTKDTPGKSNCNVGYAAAWPAFTVADRALAGGDFSIMARDDGTKQWAHKGQVLYVYAADTKPGDMAGEGQGGIWFVVKPGTAQKEVKTGSA
ncbi:MAG: hypothetical protein HEQ39_04155 [Rhizobacter sp.]